MILILGLVILIAAVVIAVAGVMSNLGSAHELTSDFSVFGYHVTSSTGALFLYGIAVGAVGLLGLALLLSAGRRAARRARVAGVTAGAGSTRREAAVADRERDDLIRQRDDARARADRNAPDGAGGTGASGNRRSRWFGGGR
ncbi:hypothetical protein [Streptomyces sp. NPDC097619]|uniref:hypothetical protein n=1 Tax=Streptomyces sp. NPDC097619 TaxID=3157228 RepID=UPI00331A90B2